MNALFADYDNSAGALGTHGFVYPNGELELGGSLWPSKATFEAVADRHTNIRLNEVLHLHFESAATRSSGLPPVSPAERLFTMYEKIRPDWLLTKGKVS